MRRCCISCTTRDDVLFEDITGRLESEALDIGIALWSHPDSGYVMSLLSCASRIAERAEYRGDQVQRAAGDVCPRTHADCGGPADLS